MSGIWILRLGHRPDRDKRVTTHVALTARVLGAKGIIVSTEDEKLEENIHGVVERFGGDFHIETGVNWRQRLKDFQGTVVHLTMYGLSLDEAIPRVPEGDILIVVGAEKVPPEVYQRADLNVAVGNQPHSEIAALAIFMDRLSGGEALRKGIPGGKMRIIPNERGKTVVPGPE